MSVVPIVKSARSLKIIIVIYLLYDAQHIRRPGLLYISIRKIYLLSYWFIVIVLFVYLSRYLEVHMWGYTCGDQKREYASAKFKLIKPLCASPPSHVASYERHKQFSKILFSLLFCLLLTVSKWLLDLTDYMLDY